MNACCQCAHPVTHVVVLPQGVLHCCEEHATAEVRRAPYVYTVKVPR